MEERAHMARLFPGHARTAGGSASGGKEANRGGRPADAPRTAAARTAEAVKKSLDFSGGQGGGGGESASCDILNTIMAGMSGTILKKE